MSQRTTGPLEHLVDLGEEAVAIRHRQVLVHASRDGARAVNLLAGRRLDHLLPEPAHHHGLRGERGMLGGHREDVTRCDGRLEAADGGAVGAEEQVGARKVEEVQRVALEDLPVVHQAPHLLGRGRQHLAADDPVHRLGGGQVMAHRADPAEALHDDRDLPVGPPDG